jgi:hypothetical protein
MAFMTGSLIFVLAANSLGENGSAPIDGACGRDEHEVSI